MKLRRRPFGRWEMLGESYIICWVYDFFQYGIVEIPHGHQVCAISIYKKYYSRCWEGLPFALLYPLLQPGERSSSESKPLEGSKELYADVAWLSMLGPLIYICQAIHPSLCSIYHQTIEVVLAVDSIRLETFKFIPLIEHWPQDQMASCQVQASWIKQILDARRKTQL